MGQHLDYSSDLFDIIKSTKCCVCVQAEGTDEVGLLGLQGLGTKSIYSTHFLFVVIQDHRTSLDTELVVHLNNKQISKKHVR